MKMSCSLPVFACIQDPNRVISILNDSSTSGEQDVQETIEDWKVENGNWDWNEAVESEQVEMSSPWLQECCISLSPSNDTLALAKNDKAVFLTSKWSKPSGNEPNIKYEISWSGCLAVEEGDCVTDILCIPLASQHKSSQGSPDWTCIVAGFKSGFMRIYLQNGSMLLSQFLHDDPVRRLKCRTWQPHKNYGSAEQVEELAILYPRAIVIIDGFSLYQSLRACRNQLAKAQASGLSELIGPPPLAYKKWRFNGQKNITDIASCGVFPPNMFDRLRTGSFLGGFNASISGNMPAMSHYITTGIEPFVAVYTAVEGSSPALISDVALAVASKLTSAVFSRITAASGWLGWGTTSSTQATDPAKPEKPKVEKGTPLHARFGLPDTRRHGNSITLAPNGRLAVTTDDFGRVMLLDAKKAIVVRLWKGYRDAECGWVMVTEENHQDAEKPKTSPRTALFLVIYATKRGILEIWRTEQGPRVAAFNVGKDCRLLYAGHGIMGLGHVVKQGQASPQHTLNCTLIQGDGTLKTFLVPFHCALSDKHSKRVRDLHLLKHISAILDKTKLCPENETEVVAKEMEKRLLNVLSDIQTPQLLQQGLQCVLSTVGFPSSLLLKAIMTVAETAQKKDHSSDHQGEEKEDTKILLDFCKMHQQLIQTHDSIWKLCNDKSESVKESCSKNSKEWPLANLLGLTKSEVSELLTALGKDNRSQHHTAEVSGNSTRSPVSLCIAAFLGCFEFASGINRRKKEEETSPDNSAGPSGVGSVIPVAVRKGLSSQMTVQLASFLFKMCLSGQCSAGRLAIPLDSSGIDPRHLMNLLISGWLLDSEPCCDAVRTMFLLHSLISTLSSFTGALTSEISSSNGHDNAVSPWWENIRHALAQSTATRRALSLAAVCRAVAVEISTASRKVEDEDEEAEREELAAGDWISVSVEIERWNLLVCQLTDLQALAGFIANLATRSAIETCAADNSGSIGLSVVGFLSSGQGAASKVLSRFITKLNIPATHLGTPRARALSKVDSQMQSETGIEDQPEIEPEPELQTELEGLSELRLRFPHSLNQDVLWSYCVMESASYWNNNKEETNKLFLALEYLRCIHSSTLQHGLAVSLWKRYLKDKISASVMLMEKVGKAPKDRLCRKTVDLSYDALEQFIKATLQLLEHIIEIDLTDSELITLESEDFWQAGEANSKSLLDEAHEQLPSNAPLVELHAKLVTVLWIIMGLEMKSIKPLSLFDTTSKESFMRDLSSSRPSSSEEVDKAIIDAREKFLTRALSFTVSFLSNQSHHPVLGGDDKANDISTKKAESSTKDWPAIIYKLAEEFGMDADYFKRHFVRELYSAGFDEVAKEGMFCVRDQRTLASQLLRIVGQRLAHLILDASESSERAIRLSRLPTQISSWIKSQDPSKLVCRTVPLSHTVDLLRLVSSITSHDSPDFPLTSGLAESIKFLL